MYNMRLYCVNEAMTFQVLTSHSFTHFEDIHSFTDLNCQFAAMFTISDQSEKIILHVSSDFVQSLLGRIYYQKIIERYLLEEAINSPRLSLGPLVQKQRPRLVDCRNRQQELIKKYLPLLFAPHLSGELCVMCLCSFYWVADTIKTTQAHYAQY